MTCTVAALAFDLRVWCRRVLAGTQLCLFKVSGRWACVCVWVEGVERGAMAVLCVRGFWFDSAFE